MIELICSVRFWPGANCASSDVQRGAAVWHLLDLLLQLRAARHQWHRPWNQILQLGGVPSLLRLFLGERALKQTCSENLQKVLSSPLRALV